VRRGHYSFFVTASTLANAFDDKDVDRLVKTTSLSALKFLTALFAAIREESKVLEVPHPNQFSTAEEFLNKTLDVLLDSDEKRIFVFIDEFEELLEYRYKLKLILSGLKETLNGEYPQVHEEGKYPGALHFFIAVTPDAYYQVETDREFSLIFGGLDRRIGKIELSPIRRGEAIRFLLDLLKYSYEGVLPDPLPVSNMGIFNAIYRISLANPGVMVSLYTRLMSSAKKDEATMEIIDGIKLISFLRHEKISVYGGSAPAINKTLLDQYRDKLRRKAGYSQREKAVKLFQILLGEITPHSHENIASRLGAEDPSRLVSIINNQLREEGVRRAVLKLLPLRPDRDVKDLLEILRSHVREDAWGQMVEIDDYRERVEDLIDRITFYEYKKGVLEKRIFLPVDRDSILSFFQGISENEAVKLENYFRKLTLSNSSPHYMISDELLLQIYPSPIPRELIFIKNRNKRLELWRAISQNLASLFESHIIDAFKYIIKKSDILKLSEEKPNILKIVLGDYRFRALIYGVNGDVRGHNINDIWVTLRNYQEPIHLVLLLYTGDLTQDAYRMIDDLKWGSGGKDLLMEVRIHQHLAKKILATYLTYIKNIDYDEHMLTRVLKRILNEDLELVTKIHSWLDRQARRGIVIKISMESTSDPRDLAGALQFFINVMDRPGSRKEVFDENRKLQGYIMYGSKRFGLIPDIEFPKFSSIVEDLLINGFLKQEGEKLILRRHPTEDRILEILEDHGGSMSRALLVGHFIQGNMDYISSLFLPVLEYRGVIKVDKDKVEKMDLNVIKQDVELL